MDIDDRSRQYEIGSGKYCKFIKIMESCSSIPGDQIMLEQKDTISSFNCMVR